jgi:hypothetical protein
VSDDLRIALYPDTDGDTFGDSSATPVYVTSVTLSGSGTMTFPTGPANYVADNSDCNDANAAIKPGANEVCDAGNVDENCNGLADNNDSLAQNAGKTLFYHDQDNDTYSINSTALFCDLPASGYSATLSSPVDCNDSSAVPELLHRCRR